MACRGVYFALSDDDARRLKDIDGDASVLKFIQEELESRWDEEWLQETDKAWDAIHRCLTSITKEWFRARYFSLGKPSFWESDSDTYGSTSDEDFEYWWSYFEQARALFEKAAKAQRAMIFTVNQ